MYDLPKAEAAAHWHVGGLWRNPPFSIKSLTYQVVPEPPRRTTPVGFGWQPGDLVIWDNLATWHYAVNDYDGPRAYRKVIAAQPAVAPAAR